MKTKMYSYALVACFLWTVTQLVSCSWKTSHDSELWKAKGENGLWGFINRKGFFVLRPVYENVENFSCGFAVVKLYGRLMIIDEFGRTQRLPREVTEVMYGGFVNNYAVVKTENQLFGVLDSNFNYALKPVFYELGGEHGVAKNGLVAFRYAKEDKIGYMDVHSGQIVIQPRFDFEIAGFVGNHAVVDVDGKSGVINTKGEFVMQPVYDWVGVLSENRFAYYENDFFGLMDSTGNRITEAVYSRIIYETPEFGYSAGNLLPVQNKDSKFGFINMDGLCKIPFHYDFALPFANNRAVVYSHGKEMLIDTIGNVIFALECGEHFEDFQHNDMILTTKQEGGFCYRNTTGKIIFSYF